MRYFSAIKIFKGYSVIVLMMDIYTICSAHNGIIITFSKQQILFGGFDFDQEDNK